MNIATFIRHDNGYYYFEFDNGTDMIFEEIQPKVLKKYNVTVLETIRNWEQTFEYNN